MILVDTTVWIDFFSNLEKPQVSYLINQIKQNNELCICGVVLTEILQGIRSHKEYHLVEDHFQSLIFLETSRSTFILAADIFRNLRVKGITIRKSVDCMIAAVALENNILLLHNDKDFDPIEKYYDLKIAR